jgi:hypothetical protein
VAGKEIFVPKSRVSGAVIERYPIFPPPPFPPFVEVILKVREVLPVPAAFTDGEMKRETNESVAVISTHLVKREVFMS